MSLADRVPARALVVGRHRLQTGLLAVALEHASAVQVVGESSCNGTLANSAERLHPDAAVVDLDGVDCTSAVRMVRVIREHAPDAAVVCVTETERDDAAIAAIAAGATRAVPRDGSVGDLVTAVSESVGDRLSKPLRIVSPLSARQIEIIDCVARGMTNDQVARLLGVSASTVKNHLYTACRRLGAASRSQAVAEAIRLGLIAP
ncbi:MAG: response regulator transcription factor [Coriobacteriales bacterium]|nr:response regulator transcription factor [Coriobacteriales bacterium]